MANWYVTDNTYEVVGNTAYAGQTVDLTISPVDSNGVHSGAYIKASDFKIGGATESSTNVWTGGNVTSGIASVTFSNIPADNSLVGDINNTVRARVTFDSSGNFPTSVADFVVDIDEKEPNIGVPLVSNTPVFLRATYSYYTSTFQSAPAVANIGAITGEPDITETVETAGSSSADYLIKFTGDVELDTQHTIAEITFTAASGYYYEEDPAVLWLNIDPPYDGMYSSEIAKTYTNGLISSFVVKLKFHKLSPSASNPFLSQNITNGMNHQALIEYTPQPIATEEEDIVTDIDAPTTVPWYGGIFNITVSAAPNSKYLLNLEKKKSVTSDETIDRLDWFSESGDVRDAGGIWNFKDKKFDWMLEGDGTGTAQVHNVEKNSFTMNANKKSYHQVHFHDQATTRRYDVSVSGIVADKKSTLKDVVPRKAGDKSIIQYGLNTLSIRPITYNNTSNIGTIPDAITVKRPIRYEGDPYGSFNSTNFRVKGGTGGVESTELTLVKQSARVKTDMIVSGPGIKNGTKVTRVRGSRITLNQAATITNESTIKFDSYDPSVESFSFTITPAAGKTLSVKDDWPTTTTGDVARKSDLIGGFKENVGRAVDTNYTDATTINLSNSLGSHSGIEMITYYPGVSSHHGTFHIVPGMTVHKSGDGPQYTTSDGTGITVASVTDIDTIVLSGGVTISNGEELVFRNANRNVDIIDITATKVDNDIVISGTLKVRDLELTGRADIYLDQLIKSHN